MHPLSCMLFLFALGELTYGTPSSSTKKSARSEAMAEASDAIIYFPGQVAKVDLSSRAKRRCSDRDRFCDELDNYPADYIANVISKTGKFADFFNVDVSPEVVIVDRSQFDYSNELTLCESTIEARYPKTGINTNNTERIIINTDGYKQLVMTEVCNKSAKCKFSETFPNDYEASCKQKYIRRRLVSLDEHSKQPYVDVYDIPCCCVCSIKKKSK